jgi:hypothetical protein
LISVCTSRLLASGRRPCLPRRMMHSVVAPALRIGMAAITASGRGKFHCRFTGSGLTVSIVSPRFRPNHAAVAKQWPTAQHKWQCRSAHCAISPPIRNYHFSPWLSWCYSVWFTLRTLENTEKPTGIWSQGFKSIKPLSTDLSARWDSETISYIWPSCVLYLRPTMPTV